MIFTGVKLHAMPNIFFKKLVKFLHVTLKKKFEN